MVYKAFSPRDYQSLMIDFALQEDRCALWADMGMGKTVSTLTALDHIDFAGGSDGRPNLVIAPLRVANSTWPDEVRKWDHLKHIEVETITGGVKDREKALRNTNAGLFTINFENITWLVERLNGQWPFGHIIIDESTKLKGFRSRQGTKRSRALSKVAFKNQSRFIELTGTPSANGLKDLWGQLWFLDKGQRLGRTFTDFKNRWFRTGYSGFGLEPMPHSQKEIEAAVQDICMSVRAKDYFDLDEPIINNIYVELPDKARRMYRTMERQMFSELESKHVVEAVSAAGCTLKCLQFANGAVYKETSGDTKTREWEEVHDVKLQALEEIVSEASGAPILVVYEFRSDLARLQRAFPKGCVLDDNPDTIRQWNKGRIPLLFTHPASAGHGLNLQDGGNIIAFFGHSWNLEYYMQVLERIGPVRQKQAGHDRPVFIHHIIAKDTVEEEVIKRLETKQSIQELLLEAMKRL